MELNLWVDAVDSLFNKIKYLGHIINLLVVSVDFEANKTFNEV